MTSKDVAKFTQLYSAFLALSTPKEIADFCYDLMTPQELGAFADRLEVAKQLSLGIPQRKVSQDTGVSIATVTRVNRFLVHGRGGYKKALQNLNKSHHTHVEPASVS